MRANPPQDKGRQDGDRDRGRMLERELGHGHALGGTGAVTRQERPDFPILDFCTTP